MGYVLIQSEKQVPKAPTQENVWEVQGAERTLRAVRPVLCKENNTGKYGHLYVFMILYTHI